MSEDNLVKEMICTFHRIPKGKDKVKFREKYVREVIETGYEAELTIFKKEKNETLFKLAVGPADCTEYSLTREKDGKIDVWFVKEDFNLESAIEFMKGWDKIYPIENTFSPCELRFKGLKKLQAVARKLLAKGIKPKYIKNITGLPLKEILKLQAEKSG